MASVYVNPGHGVGRDGGVDPGAVSATGVRECDVAQQIAARLGHLLRARGVATPGGAVESYVTAATRANALGADRFVSLHANAAKDRRAGGFEVLYASAAGARLAQAIAREIDRQVAGGASPWLDIPIPLRNRGCKRRGDLHVLAATHMPAVLIECAFLSNPREAALLVDPRFQQALAQAVADGMVAELSDRH